MSEDEAVPDIANTVPEVEVDLVRLNYMDLYFSARGNFEEELRSVIPANVIVKMRVKKLGTQSFVPGGQGYKKALKRFNERVGSALTVQILHALLRIKAEFTTADELIAALAPEVLLEAALTREKSIRFDYPDVDQSTIAALTPLSSASEVNDRLEDLERIGLVVRDPYIPGRPRHVRLSAGGLAFLRRVIDHQRKLLSSHFGVAYDLQAPLEPAEVALKAVADLELPE